MAYDQSDASGGVQRSFIRHVGVLMDILAKCIKLSIINNK